MFRPYTDNFPEVVAVAGQCLGATLTAVIWSRPFPKRSATILFGAAVWIAALCPLALDIILSIDPNPNILPVLQASATLATVAVLLHGPPWFGALGVLGQCALLALGAYVRESDYELSFAYLFWYGLLLGVHALLSAPPRQSQPASTATATATAAAAATATSAPKSSLTKPPTTTSAAGRFRRHDLVIFLATIAVALLVTNLVFERVVINGDEVANTFQADVYGHLRAYAPVPPCESMFENYWVFRHRGRVFSQYTPGWPFFMALFSRLGVIWLAGPVMAGIAAVGIARLSRRVASGLGQTAESSERIMAAAGVLGASFAMLGPAMLLNGASRFSHTMVCACFAWAVESLCVISGPEASRRRAWRYGVVLGAATSLGVATRPVDGATLGVGVFLYFLWALFHRRISWRGLLGTCLGFAFFGGLTAIVLRLQLGVWFHTAYALSASIHSEAQLRLSWPRPHELRHHVPLAAGSYCWWPAAPALGIAGLIRALGGRERRVSFMLIASALAITGFYFFVEFGRYSDDGLGPRYLLPLVVVMASGSAGILAPLVEAVRSMRKLRLRSMIKTAGPALLAAGAAVVGVVRVAPHIYPVAHAEYMYATAPLRGAKKLGLKHAIVIIEPGHVPAHETNLAQNRPMDPNPDVLFLIRRDPSDEICAREHFPGRVWYRAGVDETLRPY